MLKNYISCNLCPETPFILYKYKNSSLILNYLCPNGHNFQINIDKIKSFKKSCGKCGKEINYFNYSSIQQYYLCHDCEKLNQNLLNIYSIYSNFEDENKYNDIINKFKEHFNELIKFSEKFIYSKYYNIYQIYISDFMNLYNNKCYNQELIINMENFKKIDFKYLLLINDNYEIIFEENIPQILFSNFYNISFRKYYNSELNDFSEILKLVKLYEKHKITATEIDEEKFLKFIKKSIKNFTKSSEEYFKKIENKLKDLKIEENIVELKITVLYNDFRDIINNNLYSIYSIPSIFVLKRKLIKGIIDFIHSIEYKNLNPAIPNYKFLFMFFSRLYEIKDEIKDNKLYNNIEYVLYVIKEKLYQLINTEENKIQKFKVNIKNNVVIEKFTEQEILLINKYCSKYEKERRESKCEYSETDSKEIINMKFILSFLNYIKEESNDLIHILLEKNCCYFYNEEKQRIIPNNLKDYLNNLYENEIISEKVSGEKLIEMFCFESNINDIKNRFLNELEQFLNNNDIKLKENVSDFSSDENEINDYINNLIKINDYFQKIINKKEYKIFLEEETFENIKLGVKRKRNIIVNIENYTQFIIKEIYENLKYVELILINSQNLKEKIIKKINHNDELNLKKRKIEIILNEMKNYPMKIFSLEKIFVEWKKKELNKIKLNPDIYNLVYFELEKCSLNNFKILLKYYVDNNKNKQYYFYFEEGDIYTNLFLYQNQISPQICKLLYKYIK